MLGYRPGCVCCSPPLPLWAMSIRWFRSLRLFRIEATMFVALAAAIDGHSRPDHSTLVPGQVAEQRTRGGGGVGGDRLPEAAPLVDVGAHRPVVWRRPPRTLLIARGRDGVERSAVSDGYASEQARGAGLEI